jgi:hypothetical protein
MFTPITESELLEYLKNDGGWKISAGSAFGFYNQKTRQREEIPRKAAVHSERGVYLRWFTCEDDERNKFNAFHKWATGSCVDEHHVHLGLRLRTEAGGLTSESICTLTDLSQIGRSAGEKVPSRIVKQKLPEPFSFSKERWESGREGAITGINHNWLHRQTMISSCCLIGAVGLTDNAKVSAEVATRPNERVWFHFDCYAPSGATFDIITDGEVFYPLNRRSKRVTTKLAPKSSVDLSKLSEFDREMLLVCIQRFVESIAT